MRISTYDIKGKGLHDLISMLRRLPDITSGQASSIGKCHVFAFEEFYFRTNSNLLSLIIVHELKEDEFKIQFIAGGGGTGLLSFDWGSEDSSMSTNFKLIEDLCLERNWSLDECGEDYVTEETTCLSCNASIPSGQNACPKCGWTYR